MKLTQAPAAPRRLLRAAMPSTPPPPPILGPVMMASRRLASPFLLLAVALMASSVLLVHDSRPAAADHGDEETYWSATMTVQLYQTVGTGCTNDVTGAECSSTSVLTDDDFTYGGVTYKITELRWVLGASTFVFALDKAIPKELIEIASLYVDGTAYPLSGASRRTISVTNDALDFPHSLSWSEGDAVTVALKKPAAPPSGVELSTETLAVTEGGSATFTVALSADPGTDTTVNLVRTQYFQSGVGEPNHRWNMNAATVNPESLTFTAGTSGNWGTPQTVTVAAPQDDDSCSEQLVILVLKDTTGGESEYGALGGSITGVSVTVADDDGGSCGGV